VPRGPRQQRITLFLLKEGIADDEIWIQTRIAEQTHVEVDGLKGTLSVGHNKSSTPNWSKYLRDHIASTRLADLRNRSTAAALLFEASGRQFIACFGYGRSMISLELCEPDFGLKVVVNSIKPNRLKSIDARGFEEITRNTKRDVSRESALSAFEIDVERDVVRSLTGSPEDEKLAKRLSGADALGLNTKRQLPELPKLCSELLDAYAATRYRERGFEFIDHLRRVTNKGEKAELDNALIEALKQGGDALGDLHLAIPEAIDWLAVAGIRLTGERKGSDLHADPSITAYLRLRVDKEIDLPRLKRDQVMAIGAETEEPIGHWPIYRCIVYETRRNDRLYVLSAGDWFWVAEDYAKKVTDYVAALPELELELPQCPSGSREDAYNVAAAEATGCLCLDGHFVTKSVPDPVEICDLLSPEKKLIHVKKRGASSTLSHLFNQGVNSAEWLREDADFRSEAREKAGEIDQRLAEALPPDEFEASDYEVSFVVITRSERDSPLTLPFFSLVSLRNAARALRNQGYRVTVKAVREPREFDSDNDEAN
jgi:uncharacterized protein (TIGR04141 family)